MLIGFSSLPHGFELLKGNIHDQDEPMSGELLMLISHGIPLIQASKLHSKPPRGTLTKLQALTNHFLHQVGTYFHHQTHNYLQMFIMGHQD
jgi:hypothetical protein